MERALDDCIVASVHKIIVVLNADDLADRAPLGDLCRRYVAEANVPHQSLLL